MEKQELSNNEEKKETKPPKKRKRKPVPKKQMIYTIREKREYIEDFPNKFYHMNDYI